MSTSGSRDWMYAPRKGIDPTVTAFVEGVDQFIEFCLTHPEWMRRSGEVVCPCKKCHNIKYQEIDTCKMHLYQHGFVEGYTRWIFQGEHCDQVPQPAVQRSTEQQPRMDPYREMVYDAYARENKENTNDETGVHEEEPLPEHKGFFELLDACNKRAWSGRENMSLIECVSRLLNLKSEYNISDAGFDTLMQIIHDLLPQNDNNLPKNIYEMKKLMSRLGLSSEKIDCCEDNCMLFRGEHSEATECLLCGKLRYDPNKAGKVSRKYMFYFPLKSRLQRMYLSRATASKMTWHADHSHDIEGEMCHPCDSEAWKNFDATHPTFSMEARNIRLGLCTDGFNPHGQYGSQYSCWPVLVIPYNLPPDMCMKEATMFLTCLVPGPRSPKLRLDVFLQPLIEELVDLWNEGVPAYDVSMKTNFLLRAALLWTISDLPAYAMLSGWSTYGGFTACPVCMDDTVAIRLVNGGKQSWFDAHRRFLPADHPFRQDVDGFRAGRTEDRPPPRHRDGVNVLRDIEHYGLVKVTELGGEGLNASPSQNCGWKKKSIFWDLPYWKTNLIRHCLDPMHCEKNIFDNFFFTVLDVPGKTKDNAKAREDMKLICNRPSMQKDRRTNKYPRANYTLTKQAKDDLLQWVTHIKFPDGYASQLKRCVDRKNGRMFGMKSHDCHVFMQRLMPIAFKELLPKGVWEALTELSNFFKCLTTRVVNVDVLKKLDKDIVVVVCKLERIFPPSVFDVMEHLVVHLAREALIAGPVQFRWMYPPERAMQRFKKTVNNKARVEGSIASAYLVREATIFCTHYFEEKVLTKRRAVPRNDDGGMRGGEDDESLPKIFKLKGRAQGKEQTRYLTQQEREAAHAYIMMNCEEMSHYISLYEGHLRAEQPQISDDGVSRMVATNFTTWFRNYANQNDLVPLVFRQLAHGLRIKANVHSMYFINGYRFQTEKRSAGQASCNSGVSVMSDQGEYYGRILEILEIEYIGPPLKTCVVFKCKWYDPTPGIGTVYDERYGLVEVNGSRCLSTTDPFILAEQATQCCYIPYPGSTGRRATWLAVCTVKPRGWYEPKKYAPDTQAYQQDEGNETFDIQPPDLSDMHTSSADPENGYLSDHVYRGESDDSDDSDYDGAS